MIREFEEELVWRITELCKKCPSFTAELLPGKFINRSTQFEGDVLPILEDFRKYKPTVISLAMDPQGSGPDTHYKVLQAIAKAVEAWSTEED